MLSALPFALCALLVTQAPVAPAQPPEVQASARLLDAIALRNPEGVRLALESAVDVNARSEDGVTPLIRAVVSGDVEIVRLLLRKDGLDPNLASESGATALIEAALRGYDEIVRLLLTAGARVGAADNDGFTPLNGAAQQGHVSVVQMLLDAGASIAAARP